MPRKTPKAGAKALQLLGRWTRISQGHVPLGAGCTCGAPAVSLRVADLEHDLLDYLATRHPTARNTSSIAELLRGLSTGAATDAESLLTDLERSLASFEEAHR